MAQEIVYADLNILTGSPSCGTPPSSQPLGPPLVPRWHRTALGIGNIVLLIAVITLGVWVSQAPEVPKKRQTTAAPSSDRAGSRDICTANCSTCLEHFRSTLTQNLCHPATPGPAGHSGCKLCPTDWRLHGDKCYWVSKDSKTWDESCTNCSARGSRLLVIQDQEELESLKDLTQGTNQFWVGLSHSPEKGWTWLDGSQLDQSRFPVSGQAKENSCGLLKRNQIHSVSCGSSSQWICQRDAVTL